MVIVVFWLGHRVSQFLKGIILWTHSSLDCQIDSPPPPPPHTHTHPPPPTPTPPTPTKVSDAELMSSLICTWINGWVNTRDAGDCFIVGFTRFSVLDDWIFFKSHASLHYICERNRSTRSSFIRKIWLLLFVSPILGLVRMNCLFAKQA